MRSSREEADPNLEDFSRTAGGFNAPPEPQEFTRKGPAPAACTSAGLPRHLGPQRPLRGIKRRPASTPSFRPKPLAPARAHFLSNAETFTLSHSSRRGRSGSPGPRRGAGLGRVGSPAYPPRPAGSGGRGRGRGRRGAAPVTGSGSTKRREAAAGGSACDRGRAARAAAGTGGGGWSSAHGPAARAAAKGGLDRRAARRSRAPAPARALCAKPLGTGAGIWFLPSEPQGQIPAAKHRNFLPQE